MPRWQFAFELIRNEIEDTKHNIKALLDVSSTGDLRDDVDSLASLLLGAPLDRFTRDELVDSVLSADTTEEETLHILTASLIASPAFQWR
jgi:hypothetical protein